MSEYKNIEAYDGRTGRSIHLPANGRVALNAGDIVRVNGGEFLTLAGATVIVKVTVGLRPTPEVESAGLDVSEHGEDGYIL